ncbi:Complement factor H, partial [Camelus dromedarius]
KPCGHPGDTRFGSFHLAEGTKFEYGAKVVYTCDEGYQMLGEQNFRECETNGWSNSVPVCEENAIFIFSVTKCSPVTEPENGILSGAQEPSQEYTFGQVVQFECNSGYMLDGPKQIHCSTGGMWSEEKPKCVEIACRPPDISHGYPVSPKEIYKAKERMQYKCARMDYHAVCVDFSERGVKSPEGTIASDEKYGRGKYECYSRKLDVYTVHITFFFSEKTCDPPHIPNGFYTPELTKYRAEDKISYECKTGFYPAIHGNTATCTGSGWQPAPRCTCKFHSYLDLLLNSKIYFS